MTRSEILDKAKQCVCGDRDCQYGSPENNFQLIADLWNRYLKYKGEITAEDVAVMMVLFKIARVRTGVGTDDSFIDICGYAACGGEIHELKKEACKYSNESSYEYPCS